MIQPNMEKIKKEVDKCPPEKLKELFEEIKGYIDAKILAKSKEHSELAEHYLSLSNHINKNNK